MRHTYGPGDKVLGNAHEHGLFGEVAHGLSPLGVQAKLPKPPRAGSVALPPTPGATPRAGVKPMAAPSKEHIAGAKAKGRLPAMGKVPGAPKAPKVKGGGAKVKHSKPGHSGGHSGKGHGPGGLAKHLGHIAGGMAREVKEAAHVGGEATIAASGTHQQVQSLNPKGHK